MPCFPKKLQNYTIFHKLLSELLKLVYRPVLKNSNKTRGFWEVSAKDQGTAYEFAERARTTAYGAEWRRSSLPAAQLHRPQTALGLLLNYNF